MLSARLGEGFPRTELEIMVTTKTVYKELRAILAPLMKSNGFKNAGGGRLGWVRETADGYLTLWFSCNKWGWDERWGSTFTLELQITAEPDDAQGMAGRFERIGYVLEGFHELDEIRLQNNAVIDRLPGTLNGQAVVDVLEDGTELVTEGYKVDTRKAVYGRDVWMHYYSLDDVRDWARWLENKLLHFVSLFENEIRSEQGNARARFNQMMASVQALPPSDTQAKVALFEGYIRDESDPEFRSAASQWLDTLQGMRGVVGH